MHYHDIKKNQNQAGTLAILKGKHRDELRRIKENAKSLQKFIKEVKKSKVSRITSEKIFKSQSSLRKYPSFVKSTLSIDSPSILSPRMISMRHLSPSFDSPRVSYNAFQINTEVVTRFGIKSDATFSERPVNVSPGYLSSTSFSSKTGKLLQQSRQSKDLVASVSSLYNNKLEPLE